MIMKEKKWLYKEYLELKNAIELFFKRRRFFKDIIPPVIVFFFFIGVGLVDSDKEIGAIAIFLIVLWGFIWSIVITGFYIMQLKKLKKIQALVDNEATDWTYKEDVLKTHIMIMEKIKEQPSFLPEIFIFLCSLFITLTIVPYIIFLWEAGVLIFGTILIGGILVYVFVKYKKEKNLDKLYFRYLALIEEKLFK